jgi:HlyD family secretion protein
MRHSKRYILTGIISLFVFVLTIGAWAGLSQLQGAIVTTGEIAYTTGRTISLSHQDGGQVEALYVKPGDKVKAGDTLVRLDASLLNSESQIYEDRLFEVELRDIRLQALLENSPTLDLPLSLSVFLEKRPELARSIEREEIAFQTIKNETQAIQQQYAQRALDLEQTIQTLSPILESLKEEQNLVEQDLITRKDLFDKGLAKKTDIIQSERDLIRVKNLTLQTQADINESSTQKNGLEIALQQELAGRKVQLVEQLALSAEQIPELKERLTSIEERRRRLDIKAPVDGVINDLSLATKNVTLLPGTVVASLIPTNTTPLILGTLQPGQIDQVYTGQTAILRPMTRNYNDMEIKAHITRISDGLKTNPTTGIPFYEVVLEPDFEGFVQRGGELTSGTPFELAIQTQSRTPWSYFMEPVMRSFRKSLRE